MSSDLEARFRALSNKAPVAEVEDQTKGTSAIEAIERAGFYRDQIVDAIIIPASKARYERTATPLSAITAQALLSPGQELYSHQAHVFDHVQLGSNVVLSTPTASGKTLAFVLPTLERLLANPGATALFLDRKSVV